MNTVAIIQARMTSTRMPGKVMAKLSGKPMLGYMVDRVRRAERLDAIWVATTDRPTDDSVADYCATLGVPTFRGDEADVLGRYAGAAEAAGADRIIRLTADCPLGDPALVDEAIALFEAGDFDYCGNIVDRTYPDGLDVEVIGRDALAQCALEAVTDFDREHVTPYINGLGPAREAPPPFRQGYVKFEADFHHVRWTVDHVADYERVCELVSAVPADAGWLQFLAHATRQPALLGVAE